MTRARGDWTDLNLDGKRMHRMINFIETSIKNCKDEELRLAYLDRLMKATNTKVNIVKIILNVDSIIKNAKQAKIIFEEPITA